MTLILTLLDRLQKQKGFASDRKYRSMLHGFTTIAREEGPTAFWKGVAPTMVRNGSNQASYLPLPNTPDYSHRLYANPTFTASCHKSKSLALIG